jgi:hypothetical protein
MSANLCISRTSPSEMSPQYRPDSFSARPQRASARDAAHGASPASFVVAPERPAHRDQPSRCAGSWPAGGSWSGRRR